MHDISLTHSQWLRPTQFKSQLAKIRDHCPREGRDKAFLEESWSHWQWVAWLGGWGTFNVNHKGCSKSIRTQLQKYICITNWVRLVFQIGAALFCWKSEQTLLQIGTASLLQIEPSVATN